MLEKYSIRSFGVRKCGEKKIRILSIFVEDAEVAPGGRLSVG